MSVRLSQSSGARRTRRGLTLIEVIAGLVLASVLAVLLITSASRHHRQLLHAQLKLRAVEELDNWLVRNWTQDRNLPLAGTGQLDAEGQFRWTAFIAARSSEPVPHVVVRFEVREADSLEDRVLAAVELLVEAP